ncbi:MAG: response regulator [Bacteroidia bacterium]
MEHKVNILLVEDNPGDARLLDVYLKETFSTSFALIKTDTLAKGLDLLEDGAFDIVVLDLSLPDSQGLSTFEKVYAHSPETPVIVLTGYEDESIGINAMKLGAQDFLVKGDVTGKELTRSINYSIERFKLLKKLSENTKKLEERSEDLQKERLKLADAQKLAHIGSWEWNVEDDKIAWSDELFRIHMLDPQKGYVTIQQVYDMVHPADREMVRDAVKKSMKRLRPFSFYYRIVLADKSIKTLHARGEVIVNDFGELIGMIGTDQDVTDRIHEEELEKLALAATQSCNSVVIADNKGSIEWVNEGFTKLTGYKLSDVLNTHGEILRRGDATGLSASTGYYSTIIKEKKPISYESKNFTVDGEEYWVITTLTPVLNNVGEVEKIIAIDTDITFRKKMEEELVHANQVAEHSLMKANKAFNQLMKAKKDLEETMKVKEQFLANMSHEIRTPMNAIVGFTDILLKTSLSPEQKQYIEAIKTSGDNLLVIINDILDFSKMQSGKFSFEKIDLSLSQLISTLTELMLPKSMEKNIRLSTKIEKDVPDRLIGDPTRLNQILLNLVGNAIKFTEKGEVKVRVELISETDEDVDIRFSVSDTGIGIEEKKLNTVFEEFTQERNETTRKYGGTGLGLTIAKQLVELQGGSMSVKSKVGEGSTFTFNLKFRKNLGKSTKVDKAGNGDEVEEKVEGLNILLVEDNLLNQILAKKVLTDWNWNVELAENGLIALEKLRAQDFDVILMDIQLPEMDGYEATRQIRSTFRDPKSLTPIIAMTAHAMSGEAEKCHKAGMDDYISKPFDPKVLYSKVIENIKKNNSLKLH